jgi:hypothetical protein
VGIGRPTSATGLFSAVDSRDVHLYLITGPQHDTGREVHGREQPPQQLVGALRIPDRGTAPEYSASHGLGGGVQSVRACRRRARRPLPLRGPRSLATWPGAAAGTSTTTSWGCCGLMLTTVAVGADITPPFSGQTQRGSLSGNGSIRPTMKP